MLVLYLSVFIQTTYFSNVGPVDTRQLGPFMDYEVFDCKEFQCSEPCKEYVDFVHNWEQGKTYLLGRTCE